MNPIRKQKDEIRAAYSQKRASMDKQEKARRDGAIAKAAMSLVSFRYAEYVLLYAATENEIDISAVAEEALVRGKKIAFPRCDKETHTMRYHIVSSLDELSPEAYGILEPPADAPVYNPETDLGSAICFVPGLVYDKEGSRLGYGKGFYDRYLSAFGGSTVGVVYSDYILPVVPRGRFDVSVTLLLTEKGARMPGGHK